MAVAADSSTLWPYTSRTPSVDDRTLAINVLVYGNTTETREILESRSRGQWNETRPEEADVSPPEDGAIADSKTSWGRAHGSDRYVYVGSATERTSGLWLSESYQLHDGEYFGSRHHVRAYEAPRDDGWTAMQAHREHWDWFRFGHKVDSVEDSQRHVEREFTDRSAMRVQRVYLGNDRGSDSNGWLTIVDRDDGRTDPIALTVVGLLVPSMLVGRVTSELARVPVASQIGRALPLAGSVMALYLFVRFGAIAVETTFADADPHYVALAFYPLLLVGLPAASYRFARSVDRQTAFAAAAVGFVLAIALDYTALGVTRVPLAVLVHRISAAVALGLIAAGGSHELGFDRESRGYARTGVLLWLVTLAAPLLWFL